MKRQILFLTILIFVSLASYSQIIFEKGYFIDETGQKTECLIKNVDWKNNPLEFDYRLSENEPIQTATIETVKEFGVDGISKYKRAIVKIDRSSDHTELLTSHRNPTFVEERLFLKLLVAGKASLYSYIDGSLTRFFYQKNDSTINQLVYKRYLNDFYIRENNLFRQQLFLELKCAPRTNVNSIKYIQSDIKNFIVKYNDCASAAFIDYESTKKKDLFNLSIRPGLNSTHFRINNPFADQPRFRFEDQINFRLGVEAEFILPYNKSKWSIIADPTYQYYNAERMAPKSTVAGGILVSKINFQSVDLPLGFRHYFFLNDDSKLFTNISYVFNFTFNSVIEYERNDGSLLGSSEIDPKNNFALGLGYKLKDRFSLEMRYITSPGILSKKLTWDSEYKTLSIIFGYSLF